MFAFLVSARHFFFACAKGIEKYLNPSCSTWCFKSCFFCFFSKEKLQYIATFFHQKKHIFARTHAMFRLFLRAPNRVFFLFFTHYIVFVSAFFRAPYRFFFVCVFPCAIFFSAFIRAPYRVFFFCVCFSVRHILFFSAFFRAPYRVVSAIFVRQCTKSCVKSCYCNRAW